MFLREACEVQIGKNITQEDQAPEGVFLEHVRGFPRMARLRSEVQVRKDQRVVHGQIHTSVLDDECYGQMNIASISVQR